MPRIGLLGCGNIASILAAHATEGVEIIACYDVDRARCRDYAGRTAALGLAAGREPDVELWVDPAATSNRHEIVAAGDFGEVTIRTDNRPSPDNPATSYLAALSVLTLLQDLDDPVRVGT